MSKLINDKLLYILDMKIIVCDFLLNFFLKISFLLILENS